MDPENGQLLVLEPGQPGGAVVSHRSRRHALCTLSGRVYRSKPASMKGITAEQVRDLRGKDTGAVFGERIRAELAGLLGVALSSIPKVSYTQVSRWESRGLDPSTGKITTLVYLAALQRLRGR